VHRLDRIHIGGMRGVQIVGIRGNNFARAVSGVAAVHAIILNAERADGRGHPAILVAMVLDAAVWPTSQQTVMHSKRSFRKIRLRV